MQELTNLIVQTTPGEWLFVPNEDGTISVCVRRNPEKLEEASVFMEIAGATPEETRANARLVMIAKNTIPKLLDTSDKLQGALTAALTLMEKANVHVEGDALPAWEELQEALKALNITAKPAEDAPTT